MLDVDASHEATSHMRRAKSDGTAWMEEPRFPLGGNRARLGRHREHRRHHGGIVAVRLVKVEGTSSTSWTVPIFSGQDTILEKDQAGAATEYAYANGTRIAKITPLGSVQYYLGDHLGSTRQSGMVPGASSSLRNMNPSGSPIL